MPVPDGGIDAIRTDQPRSVRSAFPKRRRPHRAAGFEPASSPRPRGRIEHLPHATADSRPDGGVGIDVQYYGNAFCVAADVDSQVAAERQPRARRLVPLPRCSRAATIRPRWCSPAANRRTRRSRGPTWLRRYSAGARFERASRRSRRARAWSRPTARPQIPGPRRTPRPRPARPARARPLHGVGICAHRRGIDTGRAVFIGRFDDRRKDTGARHQDARCRSTRDAGPAAGCTPGSAAGQPHPCGNRCAPDRRQPSSRKAFSACERISSRCARKSRGGTW